MSRGNSISAAERLRIILNTVFDAVKGMLKVFVGNTAANPVPTAETVQSRTPVLPPPVLDLTTTTSLALGANTTAVDIQIDTAVSGVDVYVGFAADPAVATAPYKFYAKESRTLTCKSPSTLTLYFATAGGAFAAGDYIRLQEWEG